MSAAGSLVNARTFTSLRKHRNYRLYFAGQVVSLTGTWMQNVAMAWLVVVLSHSPIAVGVLAFCQFGPFAIFGLLGGVITDRFDKRRTYMTTQAASMVLAVVLTVLTVTHLATVLEVYILAAVYGTILVVDNPARQAFTMEMVGRDELPNAVALNASLFNLSRIIGPAAGGLIIAGAGVAACFALNAVSFLAVLLCLGLMRTGELFAPRREGGRPAIFRGIAEGVAYSWRSVSIRTVLLMLLFIAAVGMNFNVLLPVLARHTLHAGPETFGLLSAAFGGGALVGALLSASRTAASMRVVVASGLGLGAAMLALAPLHDALAAAPVLAAVGVCFSLYTSNSNSIIQLECPDHLRGRVISVYAYLFFGTAPVGGLFAGWLAERGGTALAFAVAGAVTLAAAAAGALVLRGLRLPRLPRRRQSDPGIVAGA
ncbi:MAG: MFS transporter [Candidatus Dormibacteria bacterium]